jgi:FKBP-type peptidyl-prolyl cis-trans isomerase FkpA
MNIQLSIFFLGLLFVSCNREPILSPEEQLAKDIGIIEQYLADNNLVAEKLESGLHYIILDEGRVDEKPGPQDQVEVKYKGYFTSGEVFDQTDGDRTIQFYLSQVIKGWQQAVPLLNRGGKGLFFIPSGLAYGNNPPSGIPANAVLIFEIELIDF